MICIWYDSYFAGLIKVNQTDLSECLNRSLDGLQPTIETMLTLKWYSWFNEKLDENILGAK